MARKQSSSKKAARPSGETRVAVIAGDDPMAQREHFAALRDALTAAHGELDTYAFDGKSAELAEVFDELRSYSLMMTYKLVIVDACDEFVKRFREPLERYCADPADSATLLLRGQKWNKGKNLDTAIEAAGLFLWAEPPKAPEAQAWLVERAGAYDCRLDRAAAGALVERLGTDLMRLETELAKLSLMIEPGGTIQRPLVDASVGRASEEQAWAVQEAVLEAMAKRRPGAAIGKVHELVDLSGQAEVLVGYFVGDLMRKFCAAELLSGAGVPQGDIAKQLKLWGPRQQLFAKARQRLKPGAAGRLFRQALTMDRRSKRSLGTPLRNLERFCLFMTEELA